MNRIKCSGNGFLRFAKNTICISCTHVDSFLSVSFEPYGTLRQLEKQCFGMSICYCVFYDDDVDMTMNQKYKNISFILNAEQSFYGIHFYNKICMTPVKRVWFRYIHSNKTIRPFAFHLITSVLGPMKRRKKKKTILL